MLLNICWLNSIFFVSNPLIHVGGEERSRPMLGRLEAHGETRRSAQQRDLLLGYHRGMPGIIGMQ